MTSLECRAVGSAAEAHLDELIELLTGLSCGPPEPVEQREVVLRPPAGGGSNSSSVPAAWKPALRLQHDLQPPNGSSQQPSEGSSEWTALQFSLHLRGKQYMGLPATLRHVTRARCSGEGVPAFWQALGFHPHYQLLRRGQRFLLPLSGQDVTVSVCRVLRLPPLEAAAAAPGGGSSLDLEAVQAAQEVCPGRLAVEAVAEVPGEADHMQAVAAVTALAALLQPYTTLQRPPRAPGEPA